MTAQVNRVEAILQSSCTMGNSQDRAAKWDVSAAVQHFSQFGERVDYIDYSGNFPGAYMDRKKAYCLIDKGRNCFILFPKGLSIAWCEDSKFWRWSNRNNGYGPGIRLRDPVKVPELVQARWLEVTAEFDMSLLTPGWTYDFVFRFALMDCSPKEFPVTITFKFPNQESPVETVSLSECQGEWKKVYTCRSPTQGKMEFSMKECSDTLKSGLTIYGIIIKPKDPVPNQ